MNIYQQLLTYYTTSEPYFKFQVQMFYIYHRLEGECGEEKLHFESEFFRKCRERCRNESGYHVRLSDTQIRNYFKRIQDYHFLASVIYAHWLHLPKYQIRQLSQAQTVAQLRQILFRFAVKRNELYFISMPDGTEMKATRNGDELLAEDGKIYEID